MGLKKHQPFELSVEEICKKAMKEFFRKHKDSLKIVVKPEPIRPVPKTVVLAAQCYLEKTGDVEKVLRYIENAFYVYRATVLYNIVAPHYKVDGVYEWPTPVKISWNSIDDVITLGEYVHEPLPKNVRIIARRIYRNRIEEKQKKIISSVNPDGSVSQTEKENVVVKDKVSGKDDLDTKFKYKIYNLEEVGFIFQTYWQSVSLKNYVNPIHWLVKDLVEEKVSADQARFNLQGYFDILGRTYMAPMGRYKKWFEPSNSRDLFMFYV